MISIIIPTLGEDELRDRLINQLQQQTDITFEIIIVDASDQPDTTTTFRDSAPVIFLNSARGRGKQMNEGASAARFDYLLFLHADSELTSNQQLANALAQIKAASGQTAGHFPIHFSTTDPSIKKALAFFEAKTRLNRPDTFNGDQGLLITRTDFFALDGFSERYTFLEDQDFGRRFTQGRQDGHGYGGRFITFADPLMTSARRFEQEGVAERLTLNTIIMGMNEIASTTFFDRAADAYRSQPHTTKLDLAPLLALAHQAIFDNGLKSGFSRFYQIGRYTNRNFWQVFLLIGLMYDEPARSVRAYDRYVRPLTDNPLGHLLGTAGVIGWFYTARLKAAVGRRRVR